MNMNIKNFIKKMLLLTMVYTLWTMDSKAQQIPLYSQYFYNQFLFNPAQTGLSGSPQLFFIYRKQWVGFNGSPETRALSFDMPIANKKAGIGVYLFSDVTNIFRKNGGYFSYAYHFNFSENHRLSLGLSGGIQESSIDFNKVVVKNLGDVLITNNNQRGVTADAAFGINYYIKGFNIGISAPQLVSGKLRYLDNDQLMGYRLARHYLATLSYDLKLAGGKFSIQPLAMFRTSEAFAFQFDAGANFKYKDWVWLGAMYRYDAAVSVAAGFKVHKLVSVGYSYDFATNNLADYTSGSHEVMLGFTFGKRNKNDDELSAKDSLIADKLNLQDSLLTALMNQVDSLNKEADSLRTDVDSLKNLAANGKLGGLSQEQMDSLVNQIKGAQKQMADSLKRYEQKMLQLRNAESSSERTKIVPREDIEYIEGAPLGDYYMVVGSFKIKDNSYKLKQQLEGEGYNVGIVYNKKRNWYYVYIAQALSSTGGLEELYELRESKKDQFSDAWIYILR